MRQFFSQAIASIAFNVKNVLSILFSRKTGVAIASILLLFVSTACNPSSPNVVGNSGSYDERKGQQSELYDAVQPNTGGMNQHNDDFRYDKGATKGKADQLIRQAERNLDKVQSPQDAVDNLQNANLGERTRKLSQEAKGNLDQLKTDLSEGTKKGTENLKANVKRAERNVKGFGNDVSDQAQRAGEDALKTTQRAIDDVTNRT
jgi:hypothetical protein